MAKGATLSLELNDGLKADVYGPYRSTNTEWGKQIQVGQLQYGQSRDIVFRLTLPSGNDPSQLTDDLITVSLQYTLPDGTTQRVTPSSAITASVETDIQRNRLAAVGAILGSLVPKAPVGSPAWTSHPSAAWLPQNAPSEPSTAQLVAVLKDIDKTGIADARLKDLKIDLEGQGVEALAEAASYNRWGRHYLPSLAHAHLLQQCNNFKDPGVQHYGGKLFHELRDAADDIFLAIPPPTPSRPVAPERQVSSMAGYYSSSAPCFAGHCRVSMADGSLRPIAELRGGDRVKTPQGEAVLVCLVETVLGPSSRLVQLGQLEVTPWHPIREPGAVAWVFPAEIGKTAASQVLSVYSFLLDRAHILLIEGYECIGLAHGIMDDEVAAHPYFGTDLVTADLKQMRGWATGHVRLASGCCIRDSKSGLVRRLNPVSEL
jgi:hypothetical protein